MKVRRTNVMANGNDLEKIRAIIESDADAIILELEDLCPLPQKDEARRLAAKVLREWDFRGLDRIVRINAPNTELGKQDLAAILPARPDGIRLPMCETVEYVRSVDQIMTDFERENDLPPNGIELILMIETPLGVRNCYELASCAPRITGIAFGANDLANALGVTRDMTAGSLQFLYARQKIALDAKAAGVDVYDTIVVCRPDEVEAMGEYLRTDTEYIKMIGFNGRSVSRLEHVAVVNQIFAPSEAEAAHAERVVTEYDNAAKSGVSNIFIDGKFVDPPILESAQKTLAYLEEIRRKKALKK